MTFEGEQKKSVREIREAVKKETYDFVLETFNSEGFSFAEIKKLNSALKKMRSDGSLKDSDLVGDMDLISRLNNIAKKIYEKAFSNNQLDIVILLRYKFRVEGIIDKIFEINCIDMKD